MKKVMGIVIFSLILCSGSLGQAPQAVTHWDFQAVQVDGTSAFGGLNPPEKVVLEGILLNSPEHLLCPDPAAVGFMGGQWQIYLQGEGADHAGTAIWMGQYYGKLDWLTHPDDSYSDQEWLDEICRVNHDPNTAYLFHPGDRVRVTGKYLFYNGKNNINEQHDNLPQSDFTITLLEPALGLPQPETVTLDALKDHNDNFIFDQTRLTGCEYYQARLIRINDVSFTDPAAWGPNADMEITDGHGKTLPVKLGIGPGIIAGSNNLPAVFDIIGIFDQEGSYPHTGGYRLWIPNYDGNGLVLTDRGFRRGRLKGDINQDGKVDLLDFAQLASEWLDWTPGLAPCRR